MKSIKLYVQAYAYFDAPFQFNVSTAKMNSSDCCTVVDIEEQMIEINNDYEKSFTSTDFHNKSKETIEQQKKLIMEEAAKRCEKLDAK